VPTSAIARYASGAWRRLRGLDRAWWDFYEIKTDAVGVVVTRRYVWREPTHQQVGWNAMRGVCIQDGGLGSDVYEIHSSDHASPILAPAECPGATELLSELARRGHGPWPNNVPGSDQVCDQCGHLFNPHRLSGYGEHPTEGWTECPVMGCECRGTWSMDPDVSNKIRDLFQPPSDE
jgi:ribosomal protein L32